MLGIWLPESKNVAGYTPEQNAEKWKIKNNFNAITKDFRTVSRSYGIVQALTSDEQKKQVAMEGPVGSGPSDVGLLFAVMKMFDPNSVVRETEFETIEAASDKAQQVAGLINRIIKGGSLTPKIRGQILATAKSFYESKKREFDLESISATSMAEKAGIDPLDVLWFSPQMLETQESKTIQNASDEYKQQAKNWDGQPTQAINQAIIDMSQADPTGAWLADPNNPVSAYIMGGSRLATTGSAEGESQRVTF